MPRGRSEEECEDLVVEAALGLFVRVGASARGVRRVELSLHPFEMHRAAQDARCREIAQAAARQIQEYFSGSRRRFDLPLDVHGTAFQCAVWRVVAEIPYGELLCYGDVARKLGKPSASRAVGAANRANPVPLLIPCHRVVAAGGKLGGYSGGLELKRRLLAMERDNCLAGQRRLFSAPA